MDELIDIVDREGNYTGQSELKSVIHQKGYYHHTAHIWLYTKNGEILLSQRSAKKTICPLMWDVSVAGHIDAGETIKKGAIREAWEEIGLEILEEDLKKIGVFDCFQSYPNGIHDNEFHNTFVIELKTPLNNLQIQEDEVEALKLVSFNQFQKLVDTIGNNENHFVPSNKDYYQLVLDSIKNLLSQ